MAREKILICGDSHGSHADYPAIEAVLRFKEAFKPQHLVHLGDMWDMACLRRGASKEEQSLSTIDDFDQGCDFAKRFFAGKAKSKSFNMGNHDQRIIEAIDSSDAMKADLATKMYTSIVRMFKDLKVDIYDWDSAVVAEIGPIRTVHGMSAALNAAGANAKAYAGKKPIVVAGHIHTFQYWREPSYDRKEAYSCPCLCDLKPDYARRNTRKLRHSRGWLYGYIDGDEAQLYCAEENKAGKFIAATGIAEY